MRASFVLGDQLFAAEHFKKANILEASPVIELAARQANAMVLVKDAQAAYEVGNILSAQQLLKNSIWSYATDAAGVMLDNRSTILTTFFADRRMYEDKHNRKRPGLKR